MPGFKALQDELGYSITRINYMSSEDSGYEEQHTLRILITSIAITLCSVIGGVTYHNLERIRLEAITKQAEYNAYHHEGKIGSTTEDFVLKGYVDNGSPQTWTIQRDGYVYKVIVERIGRDKPVPSSID
jgi:hypothetical protein